MKLKVIVFLAVLSMFSLTACKSAPEQPSSTEEVTAPIEETTPVEEPSPIEESSDTTIDDEDEISTIDMGSLLRATTSSVSQQSEENNEDESSQEEVELAEYEYVENELRYGIEISKYNGSDTNIIIPNQIDGLEVTSIGDNAFDGNEKITSVTIPNNILDIGIEAFANCTNLSNVIFEEDSKLDRICDNAFDKTALQEFTVPESCRILGDAFNDCDIKKFVILGNKTEINYMSGFSLPLDVVVYFPRGSQADGDISLHTPYTWKYLDELE